MTTQADRKDYEMFEIALNIYHGMFDTEPQWMPKDKIDLQYMASCCAADRDLLNKYTAEMLEIVAAGFEAWAAKNFEPLASGEGE